MPFFSIIIPLYNKELFIKATINSVLNQTFNDFELIIIDDGSSDNSHQIVSKYQDSRILLIKQENQGVSEARNSGIKLSKSNYIAFLDADDLWKPNHLEEIYKTIKLYPEATLYCNNYEINYNKKTILPARHNFKYKKKPFVINHFFSSSKFSPITYPSSACIKKVDLQKIGEFNKLYDSAEDLNLWINVALNYTIVFNPNITMIYTSYIPNSLSNSNYNINQYRLFSSFKNIEQNNTELKRFIDSKRYGLALRCKINHDKSIFYETINDIDFNNLSFKQKTLLKLPYIILKPLEHLRSLALKNDTYLRLFK